MKIKNTRNKIERMLELPIEVTTNIPKITITGFDQIMIENYMGIIEYEEYLVKINTSIGIIIINAKKAMRKMYSFFCVRCEGNLYLQLELSYIRYNKVKSEGKEMRNEANRVSLGAVHTHTHTQVHLEK